jgi:hypothetical protein
MATDLGGAVAKYEVVLAPAAKREVLGLRAMQDKDDLADCLRTELDHGPNAHLEFRFTNETGDTYTATPLSFKAWTAVHRRLTRDELDRLEREQDRRVERIGFLICDFLPPQSAYALGPQGPGPTM